jgi:hypothetical protein
MKKGKWNYTESIEFRVIVVKLLPVPATPLHWQNAFVNENRQVVEVTHNGRSFLIDNADGSGLLKIEAGGGPGSMSRHIDAFEFIGLVPDDQVQEWSPFKCRLIDAQVDKWQQENYPGEHKKLQALKDSWQKSPYKKRLDEMRNKNKKG